MSLEPTTWPNIGDGIMLQFRDLWRRASSAAEFFEKLKEYDMVSIWLSDASKFPVGIDTGIEAKTIRQPGPGCALIQAQLAERHDYPRQIQLRFDCKDTFNQRWYQAQLAVDCETLHNASLEFTASEPIKNFGKPAPDMEKAFTEFYQTMHTSGV